MGTAPSDLTKAFVVLPAVQAEVATRSDEARLEEAVGLTAAIDLDVVEAMIAPVTRPRPATFLGAGKVEQIREMLDARDPRPGLVIVDHSLTPVQHRNLEKEWNAKVLDRTALILEIFGARARTAEGRLQVELAHLSYQRSRLVRSWTHLERQRGGFGFLGGPGESQIEADRRALANKIDRLKEKLDQVRRTRSLQRAKRKRAPYPVVALVGYTNAGKSTLFNYLTKSEVVAKDLLFATLDPTMRAVVLRSGQRIILSDTVGFISDLPTQLVTAFRATLEEVLEADLIVHVRDAAHADSEPQRLDVIGVLKEIGIDEHDERPVIEALNKIDLLDEEERSALQMSVRLSKERTICTIEEPARIAISAVTGEGLGELQDLIDRLVTAERETFVIETPASNGAARAFLHEAGDVRSEETEGERTRFTVRLTRKSFGQFRKAFPDAVIVSPGEEVRRLA
ncbi:MAG TPA: GTPase HflX [Parvularculaceae bacterium]|nr:GTPase HflX [Caulobacterales bacterium]HPE32594.1 GTPase HflX [Parvularculaceae bacterium]